MQTADSIVASAKPRTPKVYSVRMIKNSCRAIGRLHGFLIVLMEMTKMLPNVLQL
jgi:hypothetical protein